MIVRNCPNMKLQKPFLQERDDAIHYLNLNKINESDHLARKNWKKLVGYHQRSLIETTFSQIKFITRDKLSNKSEINREKQALLKCFLINKLLMIQPSSP